jgi:hypothetical protein
MESSVQEVGPARPGITPPSQSEGRSGFLDDVIVELGFTDQQTAEWAVEQGRVVGQAVPDVLLEARILSEDQLSRATAELHGLDYVDLNEFDVQVDVARLISKSAASRYQAVPIAFDDDGTLLVALSDPVDPLAVDDIAVMTKSEVHPMVATRSSIDAVIEQLVDPPTMAPPLEVPRIESVYGRPAPEAPAAPEAMAAPEPAAAPAHPTPPAAPDPAGGEEMAQMRQALADLAARVESFTAPPAEEQDAEPPAPAEPPEPTISLEDHDGVLARLAEAERRASEANGAIDRLADSERRAKEAEAALSQLRTEHDQERLRHQQAQQALQAQLEAAKEATRRVEQRLSSVLAVTAEIRAACEKLIEPEPR